MKNYTVSIVNYGVGNILSVQRAFEKLNATVKLVSEAQDIINSDYLVFPGVGAFNKGMERLKEQNLVEPIVEYSKKGNPFLGICLGMQLMMTKSHEFGETEGLNLIQGEVINIPETTIDNQPHKIPHIGWNIIEAQNEVHPTIKDVNQKAFYFVHSFMAKPEDPKNVLATTEYNGRKLTAMIGKDNILGCQFHPEKSCQDGLSVLTNFLQL